MQNEQFIKQFDFKYTVPQNILDKSFIETSKLRFVEMDKKFTKIIKEQDTVITNLLKITKKQNIVINDLIAERDELVVKLNTTYVKDEPLKP